MFLRFFGVTPNKWNKGESVETMFLDYNLIQSKMKIERHGVDVVNLLLRV